MAAVTHTLSCSLSQPTRTPPTKRRTAPPPLAHMSKPLPPPPPASPTTPVTRTTSSPTSRPAFRLAIDTSDSEEDTRHTDTGPLPLVPAPVVFDYPSMAVAEHETSRRYHALSELLSTELGYLLDLRIFVSVYLRLLPVLKNRSSLPPAHPSSSNSSITYFSRPPLAHSSLRAQSYPHFGGGTYLLTLPPPAEDNLSATTFPPSVLARVENYTTRHLFSASDLDTITRNAEDILEFHERLVRQLGQVISPCGISMDPSTPFRPNSPIDVHHAIDAVSTVFVNHAANFDRYQFFCSGHSEAFDLVRKVQHRYPNEWDAFELRCAAVAAETHSKDVPQEFPPSESGKHFWHLRRHSLSSLEAPLSENLKAPMLSASESGHVDGDASARRPQLMFMDYMIKPVQRVCRYPLLFDQLQERSVLRGFNVDLDDPAHVTKDTDQAAKTALWSMRTVARLVDEARRQQDLFAKSAQIVSRITQGLLASVTSHNRSSQSASLPTFLSTLGPCYLSGSLDVIHYRDVSVARLGTVRAKYLGAFLFPGGFLVLVKVAKSKVYEPKYWFNVRAFELVDSNLDDVLLPSWFRLSSKAHMFEFAASCRREKDIWMDAIRGSVMEEVPWSDEPPLNLQADVTTFILGDAQPETISPLPTIKSIPELDDAIFPNSDAIPPSDAHRISQASLCAEIPIRNDTVVGPARRSSFPTASVPESNTFHLVRSTAAAREQVDRGLLDVFSEKCLTARFHAHAHEEGLFEAQKVTHSFSRSVSALTMAGAMSVAAKNKLTKRESVFVPRKRSSMEGNGMLGDTENHTSSVPPIALKSTRRQHHPNTLSIIATARPTSREGYEDRNEPLDSSSPMSHCSFGSFLTPVTPLTTPVPLTAPSGQVDESQPHNEFLSVCQNNCAPKRRKSMVENVRSFFTPKSASPVTGLSREPSTKSSVSSSSLLRWWSRESRVRSASDLAREELPSHVTITSLLADTVPRRSVATADPPYSQPDLQYLCSEIARGPSTREFGIDLPQKRGLFASSSNSRSRGPRRRWTASPTSSVRYEQDSTLVSTRTRQKFLHRLTHGARDYDDTDTPPLAQDRS